jgi:hypothetical protein|tara:strand:+ start:1229 stop:1972 length:744 start_codon:yes stop_codon:yes gene_type:complete
MPVIQKIPSLLFDIYLFVVSLLVFWPIKILIPPIHKLKNNSDESFFEEVSENENMNRVSKIYSDIHCYSAWMRFALYILFPAYLISKKLPSFLFEKKTKPVRFTPNQAASMVLAQMTQNIKATKTVADDCGADYIFCLQPTLMDGKHYPTEYDLRFIEARAKTKFYQFTLLDYFKKYYEMIIRTFSKYDGLKNNFFNLSNIFHTEKKQRFVDTCHIGEEGQIEIARKLASFIFEKEKKQKKNTEKWS